MNYLSGFGPDTVTELIYGFGSRALWSRGILGTPLKVASSHMQEPLARAIGGLTDSLKTQKPSTGALNETMGGRVTGPVDSADLDPASTDSDADASSDSDSSGDTPTSTPMSRADSARAFLNNATGGSDSKADLLTDAKWVAGATLVYGTAANILETGINKSIANTLESPLYGNPIVSGVTKIATESPGLSMVRMAPSLLSTATSGYHLLNTVGKTATAFGDYMVDRAASSQVSKLVDSKQVIFDEYSTGYQSMLQSMLGSWTTAIQEADAKVAGPEVMAVLQRAGSAITPALVDLMLEDPEKGIPILDSLLTELGVTDIQLKVKVGQHLAMIRRNAHIHGGIIGLLQDHFGYMPSDILHRYITASEGPVAEGSEVRAWLVERGIDNENVLDRMFEILVHVKGDEAAAIAERGMALNTEWDGYNSRIESLEDGMSGTSMLGQLGSLTTASLSFGAAALGALGWGSNYIGREAQKVDSYGYRLPQEVSGVLGEELPGQAYPEITRAEQLKYLNPLKTSLLNGTNALNLEGAQPGVLSNSLHSAADGLNWASNNFMTAVVAGGAAYKGWHLWSAGYALARSAMAEEEEVKAHFAAQSKESLGNVTSNLHHWAATAALWDVVPTVFTETIGGVVEQGIQATGFTSPVSKHTLGRMALSTPAAAKTVYNSAMYGYYSAKQWWSDDEAEKAELEETKNSHWKGVEGALVAGGLNMLAYSVKFQGNLMAKGLDFAADMGQYGTGNAIKAHGLGITNLDELETKRAARQQEYDHALNPPVKGSDNTDKKSLDAEDIINRRSTTSEEEKHWIRQFVTDYDNCRYGDPMKPNKMYRKYALYLHPDKMPDKYDTAFIENTKLRDWTKDPKTRPTWCPKQ